MKRFLIAGLAGVSVFGAAYGFAAAVSVTSDDFGSGDSTVTSCETGPTPGGVNASYTTSYDEVDGRYEVTSVEVEGLAAACDGHKVGVTLSGPLTSKGNIGDGTSTFVVGTPATTKVSVAIGESPSAESVTGVHVVVYESNSTSNE